jgi:hypothetical protein
MQKPEHEYVDMLLTIEGGKVVSAEYFGEGVQVEPITDPMLLKVIEGEIDAPLPKRLERQILRKLKQRT